MFETLESRCLMSVSLAYASLNDVSQTYDAQSKLGNTQIQTASATTKTTSTILKQQSDANNAIIAKL